MKNIFIFLLILILSPSVFTQTYNTFEGAAENQRVYKPLDLRNFKPLSANEETVLFTGVFHGQVVGGFKFVWLEDELAVRDKTTGKISRIYLCGNEGEFFSFPKKSVTYLKGDKGDPGYTPKKGVDYFDGKNGKDGRDGRDAENLAFNPFYIGNLLWEIPVVGLVIYGLVKLAQAIWPKHEDAVVGGQGPDGITGPIFKINFNFGN